MAAALPILCAAVAPAADDLARGVLIERVSVLASPEESYALYLPTTYSPDRPAPILYAFDPRARGRAPADRRRTGWARAGPANTWWGGTGRSSRPGWPGRGPARSGRRARRRRPRAPPPSRGAV